MSGLRTGTLCRTLERLSAVIVPDWKDENRDENVVIDKDEMLVVVDHHRFRNHNYTGVVSTEFGLVWIASWGFERSVKRIVL